MSTKILLAPRQPEAILDIARSLAPPGYELVIADVGSAEFKREAAEIEYYLGHARKIDADFFRTTPKLRLVQLWLPLCKVDVTQRAGPSCPFPGGATPSPWPTYPILILATSSHVLPQLRGFGHMAVGTCDRALFELSGRTLDRRPRHIAEWRVAPQHSSNMQYYESCYAPRSETRSPCASGCSMTIRPQTSGACSTVYDSTRT